MPHRRIKGQQRRLKKRKEPDSNYLNVSKTQAMKCFYRKVGGYPGKFIFELPPEIVSLLF